MVSLSASLIETLHNYAAKELEASLLYLQAHHWLEVRHFDGFADRIKSFGEKRREWHNKVLDYITLRGNEAKVHASPLPAVAWENEVQVYEYFLALEEAYYLRIKEVFAQARNEHDFDVEKLLSEILEEQVVRCDDWEGDVFKIRGYSQTAGLVWLYNDRKS
jgi:ferritin